MSRIIKDSDILDYNLTCYICNWTWDRNSYTQWHHLLEDHYLELCDAQDALANNPVIFEWQQKQRVLR